LSFMESSMKIKELLKKEFILEQLKAKSKQEALAELAGAFAKSQIKFDSGAMLRVLLEREKLGSTGIGDGIAIPHGKLAGLDEILVAFGRSREGIAFEALDGGGQSRLRDQRMAGRGREGAVLGDEREVTQRLEHGFQP